MRTVTLDDKYAKTDGRIYVTGSQALVRLPILQRARDVAAGLNTAGFISGYRGSPLGIYDLALWGAMKHLEANHIRFSPGINEDMAATAVWGSQQVGLIGEAKYDGVFAMWYGKGPGVDRSGDPLKHGSYAGSSPNGGVLVLCGDDHGARSSTTAHQSDHALIHFGMPILHPASVQEFLDLGLVGFALARYSGCWIGFKCVTDTVEGSASVSVDPARIRIEKPTDFVMPPDGLNIRLGFLPLQSERLLYEQRHLAVAAFARANRLDGVRLGRAEKNRLGIVTTGKSYLDVLEGLARLGIDDERARHLGIAVYKVALVWPLEATGLAAFAQNCEELLVVEEKRPVIEEQVAHILYNAPVDRRPRLTGKHDERGAPLLSAIGELDPDRILHVIADRYLKLADDSEIRERLERVRSFERDLANFGSAPAGLMRLPSFCAGCPHNTSTRVPEGSIALGGIGCHGMAVWLPERKTLALYQMGGEGAPWIGQAPFVETPHIFQNLGDGTYFHSGLLAIRACVAAGVNITYKILLNGAIAMTGGQPIEGEHFEGELTAPHVASQLFAEGVGRIASVSDDPEKYGSKAGFPASATFHHRDQLDAVQKELRDWRGVSAIIYDQSCATERRRLRKRGKVADPSERLFIHPEVCEGCGDCGIQSNCIALEPEETQLGRKRRINQSVCNKDYSCVKGFCPSFVSVTGGKLRAREGGAAGDEASLLASLPEPELPNVAEPYSLLIGGIGGNGVVTIAALLGMAAHIEEKPCTVLDISGLAQRNGAVTSHVRFGPRGGGDLAARIPQGSADVMLACDLVVAASPECISRVAPGRARIVANSFIAPTSAFARAPDLDFGGAEIETRLAARARDFFPVDATGIATKMLGNAIGANSFMLGYAWQRGLIPLSAESIETAIDLNGTAVALNQRAFALGRIAAAHPEKMPEWTRGKESAAPAALTLEEIVTARSALLTDYQDAAYAERYRALVRRVETAECAIAGSNGDLAKAVARTYAKLMAYKDEYEVDRLFASSNFRRYLDETFEGDFKLSFNLAPPLLARRDAGTGRLRKMRFGPWMMPVFRLLARLKFLRGSAFDIFGMTAHRRLERKLIADYEALVDTLLRDLDASNYATAVELARLPETVRGYDVVKETALAEMLKRQEKLLAEFRKPTEPAPMKAETVAAE